LPPDAGRSDVVVYDEGSPHAAQPAHIVRHDQARVLEDVTVVRRILALYDAKNGPGGGDFESGRVSGLREALEILSSDAAPL
jgi:hypothetical protein